MSTFHIRRPALLLASGLFLAPLAACSGDAANTDSSGVTSASDAAESAAEAGESAAESAGEAAESAAESVNGEVDCSGTSCTVTLAPDAGEVEVLGTRLAYEGIEDGEATVAVGNDTATCAEGESVDTGPLTLECTTVSEEELTLTASLG